MILTKFSESQETGVDSQGEFYGKLWGHHWGQNQGTLQKQLVAISLGVFSSCIQFLNLYTIL